MHWGRQYNAADALLEVVDGLTDGWWFNILVGHAGEFASSVQECDEKLVPAGPSLVGVRLAEGGASDEMVDLRKCWIVFCFSVLWQQEFSAVNVASRGTSTMINGGIVDMHSVGFFFVVFVFFDGLLE